MCGGGKSKCVIRNEVTVLLVQFICHCKARSSGGWFSREILILRYQHIELLTVSTGQVLQIARLH